MEFSHFDEGGNAVMVDVSGKEDTVRTAAASGEIFLSREAFELVKSGGMKKGDVLGTARIAGIMGAKRTWDLIPLCHCLNLTSVRVDFELRERPGEKRAGIHALCTVSCRGKTGVEMEALTGVSTALLTVYDMCKAVDRGMEIGKIFLLEKHGGKSGDYCRERGSDPG